MYKNILNWVRAKGGGGSIFGKFQRVPNFWVLLHFYVTISKIYPISVGLREGMGPDPDISSMGGLSHNVQSLIKTLVSITISKHILSYKTFYCSDVHKNEN